MIPEKIQRRVDAIWAAEQARRSSPPHDGELFSLIERAGTRWIGAFVPYRRFLAQLAAPELFDFLQVRAVAVSGVLSGPDGIVFGRRAEASTQFPGWWELAPSGGLDRACEGADGTIDYAAKLLDELREETGCPATAVTRIAPLVAIEDPVARSIDIGLALTTDLRRPAIERCFGAQTTGEYSAIEVVHHHDIAAFVRRHDAELVEVSRVLLERSGRLELRPTRTK